MEVADRHAADTVMLFLHFLYLVSYESSAQSDSSKRLISTNQVSGKCARYAKLSSCFCGASEVKWITSHKDFSKFRAKPAR